MRTQETPNVNDRIVQAGLRPRLPRAALLYGRRSKNCSGSVDFRSPFGHSKPGSRLEAGDWACALMRPCRAALRAKPADWPPVRLPQRLTATGPHLVQRPFGAHPVFRRIRSCCPSRLNQDMRAPRGPKSGRTTAAKACNLPQNRLSGSAFLGKSLERFRGQRPEPDAVRLVLTLVPQLEVANHVLQRMWSADRCMATVCPRCGRQVTPDSDGDAATVDLDARPSPRTQPGHSLDRVCRWTLLHWFVAVGFLAGAIPTTGDSVLRHGFGFYGFPSRTCPG